MEKLEKKRACAFLDETGENGGEEIFAQSYNQRAENNVQHFTFTRLVRDECLGNSSRRLALLERNFSKRPLFYYETFFPRSKILAG